MQIKYSEVFVCGRRKGAFRCARQKSLPFGVAAVFAACLILQGCQKEEPPAPAESVKLVKIMTVASAGLAFGKEYPGRAEASRTAELSFRVAGPLIERPVQQGDRVKQGDLLAKIDPRDFETGVKNIASQLDQTNAELTRMKAGARPEELRRLEANQLARKSELDEAQTRFERNSQLLKQEVISQQEFDQVRTAYDVARANLESANQELEIGRKGARIEDIQAQEAKVKGLEAQLAESRAALSDTELRASFPGVIARTYVENFEDVEAKQPILSIQDTSNIDIKIYVPEGDLGRGLRGRSIEEAAKALHAVATFGALSGREFPLVVKEYQTEADPQTQTFEIVLQMEQPADNPVIPGMNATVRGKKESRESKDEGIMVPVSAIFADEKGNRNVWIVDQGTQQVSKRPVDVDWMSGDQAHVTGGLAAGEMVVVSAVSALSDGMKVGQMPDLGEM